MFHKTHDLERATPQHRNERKVRLQQTLLFLIHQPSVRVKHEASHEQYLPAAFTEADPENSTWTAEIIAAIRRFLIQIKLMEKAELIKNIQCECIHLYTYIFFCFNIRGMRLSCIYVVLCIYYFIFINVLNELLFIYLNFRF